MVFSDRWVIKVLCCVAVVMYVCVCCAAQRFASQKYISFDVQDLLTLTLPQRCRVLKLARRFSQARKFLLKNSRHQGECLMVSPSEVTIILEICQGCKHLEEVNLRDCVFARYVAAYLFTVTTHRNQHYSTPHSSDFRGPFNNSASQRKDLEQQDINLTGSETNRLTHRNRLQDDISNYSRESDTSNTNPSSPLDWKYRLGTIVNLTPFLRSLSIGHSDRMYHQEIIHRPFLPDLSGLVCLHVPNVSVADLSILTSNLPLVESLSIVSVPMCWNVRDPLAQVIHPPLLCHANRKQIILILITIITI